MFNKNAHLPSADGCEFTSVSAGVSKSTPGVGWLEQPAEDSKYNWPTEGLKYSSGLLPVVV